VNEEVRFVQEKRNVRIVGNDFVEVAVVARIGRADQVRIIPGNDEERPSILPRLTVQRIPWRAWKGRHDDVTPFGTADEARSR
jgi:hypothetical protein